MAELSAEDFGRLQTQLLELREKNYVLDESLKKHKKEISDHQHRIKLLEEENTRQYNSIKASKRTSEIDLLLRDNNHFRNKLRDQEEDFRLQNTTLLQELSRLVSENERYERQIAVLCGGDGGTSQNETASTSDPSEEVLRLRKEITNLDKKLYEAECKAESESNSLREKIGSLNAQTTQLTKILRTHSIPIDEGEISLSRGGGVSFKKLSLQDDDGLEVEISKPSETLQKYQEHVSYLQSEVEQLKATLKESEGQSVELRTQNEQLQEQIKNVEERMSSDNKESLRRNAEQLESLQSEMEEKLKSQTTEFSNQTQLYTKQLTEFQENLSGAKEEVTRLNKALEEKQSEAAGQINELEDKLKKGENLLSDTQKEISDVQNDLQTSRKQVEELDQTKTSLEEELKEQVKEKETLNERLSDVTKEHEETTKVAESRRAVIEEMKSHMADLEIKHKSELEQMSSTHSEEMAKSAAESQQLREQLQDVSHQLSEVGNLQESVKNLEGDKKEMEEKLVKAKEEFEKTIKEKEEEINRRAAENIQVIEDLKYKWEEEKKDLATELEISNIQRQELEEANENYKHQLSDGEEERRIHERKGLTLMKDLKKQLSQERKRADRLQEKLSQLLTDPAQLTAITTFSDHGDDVSSVSSWSMVSGEHRDSSTRENSIIASPHDSPPPGPISDETASLVSRVAELQQQKWQMEERLGHLEASSGALAEDLLKKTAIIQHYCMDAKATDSSVSTPVAPTTPSSPGGEKLNVRRMLDLLRGVGNDESLREVNRRLQSLLEETLTKNMQLHKDVDNLSEQVHQLSKLAALSASQQDQDVDLATASTTSLDHLLPPE
ncbi:GRIP1-associated protein 1-like isoform X1 [Oratosquilla oratoria]|uniref:GRIP1-associated protein 1-like isoform X1 n=1 Tax=Oratosquilla oratoria TaxID=337810 RepID=UPI003F7713C7